MTVLPNSRMNSTDALDMLLAGRTTRSAFWTTPSQHIAWQHFVTSIPVVYPAHTHPEYNIVVCLRGAVEVRQCGNLLAAESGEALVGNARIPHQSTYRPGSGHCEAISLTVSSALLRSVLLQLSPRANPVSSPPVILQVIQNPEVFQAALTVRDLLLRRCAEDAPMLESLARRVVAESFGPRSVRTAADAPVHPGPFLPRWQYVRTHEAMLASSNLEFSVSRIAREVGISPGRFHLLFRSSTGVPPAQYFHGMLMARASRRLLGSEQSIKELSYDLGFCSPSHFCSAFKRHFGISPVLYREGKAEPGRRNPLF